MLNIAVPEMALKDKIKRLKLFEYLNIDKSLLGPGHFLLNSFNVPRAKVEIARYLKTFEIVCNF